MEFGIVYERRMTLEELKGESTENLIEYIRCKDDPSYAELARNASHIFIFRFQHDIVHKCKTICPKWGYNETDAEMIAEKALERFLRYPNGFNKEKCRQPDINVCIRLYMYRIVGRLLIDKKNQDKGIGLSPYDGTEEIVRAIDIENIDVNAETKRELKKKCEIIEKALASLTPKHKIIFLTYQTHQKDGFQMPRELLKSLREELELTQNSVQVYKKEAYDAFHKHLEIYGG